MKPELNWRVLMMQALWNLYVNGFGLEIVNYLPAEARPAWRRYVRDRRKREFGRSLSVDSVNSDA